jgi:hypothetical protein
LTASQLEVNGSGLCSRKNPLAFVGQHTTTSGPLAINLNLGKEEFRRA